MASNNLETTLAIDSLRAPLNVLPLTSQQRCVNDLRIKYRTYYIEYDISEGAVMLPKLFTNDFGDEICRVVTLFDHHENQFEILVEKINQNIYFTRGWAALRDFYNIRFGAWLQLVYMGNGSFGIILEDRFQERLTPPTFVPPMKFVIDMHGIPTHFVDDLPHSINLLSYSHPPCYFNLSHYKNLTYHDIWSGFLVIPYDGFGEYAFDENTDFIKLVDDCGNAWNCSLKYVTFPYKQYKLGGEWLRLVDARRFSIGGLIKLGALPSGHSQSLYIIYNP